MPSYYSTATAGFGYQLFKELFYYVGMISCAKYNRTVTVFSVSRGFNLDFICNDNFNKILMKCLFLL